MQEIHRAVVAAGAHFDDTALAALLGVIITCIVTWGGHLVTNSSAAASNRLARHEKRAFLGVRDLVSASGGTVVRGQIVNCGATAAIGVEVRAGGETEALGVVGAGDRLAFEFAAVPTDGATLQLSYRDFVGRRHLETFALVVRRGRNAMTSIDG